MAGPDLMFGGGETLGGTQTAQGFAEGTGHASGFKLLVMGAAAVGLPIVTVTKPTLFRHPLLGAAEMVYVQALLMR